MKTSIIVWVIVALVVVGGGWYWYSMQNSQASEAAGPSTTMGTNDSANQGNMGGTDTGVVQQPGADGAEGSIIGANLALGIDATGGAHLIGYNGMTVYTKDGDSAKTSSCYGDCAQKWPPYLVGPEDNVNQLKAGVTGSTGTITRTDSTLQMTYKGKPLYFYASDTASGQVTGDGIGGVWHVAKP